MFVLVCLTGFAGPILTGREEQVPKPKKYREMVRALRKADKRFQFWENRGKGSERMIYHPDIGGRPESFPVKCHGEGTELRPGVLADIIRRFKLQKDFFD